MVRYFFVAFSLLGFVFFDMVYLSVIVTYASQSELIQFYIMGIIDKVNTKAYSLEEAMKVLPESREREGEREKERGERERERERERENEGNPSCTTCTLQDIQRTYDYLRVMNGKLATLTTLCLLIFIEALISCKSVCAGIRYRSSPLLSSLTTFTICLLLSSHHCNISVALNTVLKINGSDDKFQLGLSVAVGFSSVILWTLLILLPLAQVCMTTFTKHWSVFENMNY
jgi:hypothetical protein